MLEPVLQAELTMSRQAAIVPSVTREIRCDFSLEHIRHPLVRIYVHGGETTHSEREMVTADRDTCPEAIARSHALAADSLSRRWDQFLRFDLRPTPTTYWDIEHIRLTGDRRVRRGLVLERARRSYDDGVAGIADACGVSETVGACSIAGRQYGLFVPGCPRARRVGINEDECGPFPQRASNTAQLELGHG